MGSRERSRSRNTDASCRWARTVCVASRTSGIRPAASDRSCGNKITLRVPTIPEGSQLRANPVPAEHPDHRDQNPTQLADTVSRDDLIQHPVSRSTSSRGRRRDQHQHCVRIREPLHGRCSVSSRVVQCKTGMHQPYVVTFGQPQAELACGMVVELRRPEYVLAECGEKQRGHGRRADTAGGPSDVNRRTPHCRCNAGHVPSSTRSWPPSTRAIPAATSTPASPSDPHGVTASVHQTSAAPNWRPVVTRLASTGSCNSREFSMVSTATSASSTSCSAAPP